MSADFFKQECLTITNERRFGICDGEDHAVAFTTTDNEADWIAAVVNDKGLDIEFRAIDFCVTVLRADGNQERSCDCMLIYPNNIVFIELKNERHSWMSSGIEQLELTISRFNEVYKIENYKRRRAFVANRRHPNFHVIEDETKIRFRDKYKVRLDVQAKIVVS